MPAVRHQPEDRLQGSRPLCGVRRGGPARSEPRPPPSSQRHAPRGAGAHHRGEARPPHVGAQEAHRLAPRHRARHPLARSQHRRRHPRSGRPGTAPTASPPYLPLERSLRSRHRRQRRLVHRLQRLVPHRRRDACRPPHRPRRRLPLPHRLPRAGAPHRPGDAARVSARLPRVRPPQGHPHRQRSALRRHRLGQPLPPWPSGGSSWASSPSASPRAIPNRTDASSASTAPSKPRRPRRPRPTHAASSRPSTASGAATTPSAPTRPWVSVHRPSCTRPRFAPILHSSAHQTMEPRSRCAACAATARSSGRETWST